MTSVPAAPTVVRTASPSTARAIDDRLALELIQGQGPLTATQLKTLTGLYRPTVADLVERLQDCGLIRVVGEAGAERRGPNARLYKIAADPFLDALAGRLALGVASVAAVLDPGCVVLGGEVGHAGGDALADRVVAHLPAISPLLTEVRASRLGGTAVLHGALPAARNAAQEELFSPEGRGGPASHEPPARRARATSVANASTRMPTGTRRRARAWTPPPGVLCAVPLVTRVHHCRAGRQIIAAVKRRLPHGICPWDMCHVSGWARPCERTHKVSPA